MGDLGEAVERTQCEASAAKFLSNSESDKCCRKEKSASFSKCVVGSSEQEVASPVGSFGRLAQPSLIFADFSVILSRWGLFGGA